MHLKKLQFRTVKKFFITLCLLTFTVSIVFAQNSGETQAPPPTEDHDTKELDSLINKYNVNSEKVLDDASKLNQDEATVTVDDAALEEMRPISILEDAKKAAFSKAQAELKKKEAEALAASQKGDFSLSVKMALEPLQSLTEEQLKQRLQDLLKDNPARHYFDKFPEIITLSVRLIKDKESIPSIVKIAADKNRLIEFVAVMLLTIIAGFFLRKLFHKEGRSFLGVIFFFILRVLILLALRIYIIYYYFHVELTPAAKIVMKTFFP